MSILHRLRVIGLDTAIEPGVSSYRAKVAAGLRQDSWFARFVYLLRANCAASYIEALRRSSNDPRFIQRVARIERMLKHPLHRLQAVTRRAADFQTTDMHIEKNIIDTVAAERMRRQIVDHHSYFDPYIMDFRHRGPPEQSDHPVLYMDIDALLRSTAFFDVIANPAIVDFCREVLGPSAAVTWAWAWISQPTKDAYQNQNWHRDSAEPFNFVRVFIPLSSVASLADGPTEFIPGTSELRACYEMRRYGDDEVAPLKTTHGNAAILCQPGDVYYANTFALHRGTPPQSQRAMLSLLVSLSPSHRTPSIPGIALDSLPAGLRERLAAHRSFFRYLVR